MFYQYLEKKKSKTLLVFTHGFVVDNQTFKSQVKLLKEKYSILVWDLPQHGKSKSQEFVSLDQTSRELEKILVKYKQKYDNIILIGQSLGSMINQVYANNFPEKISAIIDVGGMPMHHKYSKMIIYLIKFFSKILIKVYSLESLGRKKANKLESKKYISEKVNQTNKKEIKELVDKILNYNKINLIDLPTLIINGEFENKSIMKKAKKWSKESDNFEFYIIKNAGHIANQDCPEEFSKKVDEFIETKVH